MNNEIDILHPTIAQMLKAMEVVFREHGVNFYLVGAVARDIHLSAKSRLSSKRRTEDVDIAVMIADEEQFYAVKNALLQAGEFSAHATEAIKLFYKESIEVDLLPFGKIENEYREARLQFPKLFVMDVPGFSEVYPFIKEVKVLDDLVLNVCSIEGLIVLKLIAWDYRPSRTKDIEDVDHIIDVYFDLNDDEVYSSHYDVMELYDPADLGYLRLISARIIGRKMSAMLYTSALRSRLAKIIARRPIPTWEAMLQGLMTE